MEYYDIKCPYCKSGLEINHDDGFGIEENEKHHMECEHCGKWFYFKTTITFFYDSYPADCLNDDNHTWKPTKTFPKQFTLMECEICGEKRTPTEEEMNKILVNDGKT